MDQRQWAQKSWKSLAQRRAEELEDICKTNNGSSHDRLRTLCSLTHGTDSLKEYLQELLESSLKTNRVRRLPRLLLVNVTKGSFGLFNQSLAQESIKEYERIRILIKQPVEIKKSLQCGDTKRTKYLRRRLVRWKKEFETRYKESVSKGFTKSSAIQMFKLGKKET
jgi:hypothetical protein